jgi:hypothetical protein
MRFGHFLDEGRECCPVADVADVGLDGSARRSDCGGEFIQRLLRAGDSDDMTAVFRKPDGDGPADAAAGSSDDGNASIDGSALRKGSAAKKGLKPRSRAAAGDSPDRK